MPKLTLMLDGKPMRVYDLDQPVIRVGRGQGMDILIENVSVSRRQAEIQKDGDVWVVRDLGSSSGTFVNGEKLAGDRPLRPGDEIWFGKFSLVFERIVTEAVARGVVAAAPVRPSPSAAVTDPAADADATRHLIGSPLLLSSKEAEELQKAAAQRRPAHVPPARVQPAAPVLPRSPAPEGGGLVADRTVEAPGSGSAAWWRGWLRATVAACVAALLIAGAWTTWGTRRNDWRLLEHLAPAYAAAGILPDERWCVLAAAPDFVALSPRDRERRAEAFFDRELAPLLEALFYQREPFRTQFIRSAALDVEALPIKVWRQESTVYRREQPYRDISQHAMPQRDYLGQARAVGLLAVVWTAAVMGPVVVIASVVRWAVRGFRSDPRRP